MHYACYWGEAELILPLLELERDVQSGLVNVRDRNGDTGLHIASRGGFKAIVKELLRANANRDIQNKVNKGEMTLVSQLVVHGNLVTVTRTGVIF